MRRIRHRIWVVRDVLLASDPGYLRLRMALQTVSTLVVSLLVLVVLTGITGQPVTVALLGVVIAMMASMAVNDPDPRKQRVTLALLPIPAAVSVTLGAVLSSQVLLGDVVFVAIMFTATWARRFGNRGMALGMAAFMTYFFALFLRATVGQLPWLIGAIVVGTACSLLMRTFVFRTKPERVLRSTIRALWARVRAVVAGTADALQNGSLDERARRSLRRRITRLNDTALLIENQLDDTADAAALWPGVGDDELALRLFDVELAVERLARAGIAGTGLPDAVRGKLVGELSGLRSALRTGDFSEPAPTGPGAEDRTSDGDAVAVRLRAAMSGLREAARQTQALADRAVPDAAPHDRTGIEDSDDADTSDDDAPTTSGSWVSRLRPTTRQAVQVSVAAAIAIVAGELVSPARWYWAVIAAFVVFTGTGSRGQTLTKGSQRLVGTLLGVPVGILIATLVNGSVPVSIVLIFVAMFVAFYFLKVSYGVMVGSITGMLALLYGLLGQFTVGVLLLRIEETAIGAVAGVLAALFVLPTSTRGTVRDAAGTFLTSLGDAVQGAVTAVTGSSAIRGGSILQVRDLDQQLQQLRLSARPMTNGLWGLSDRGDTRNTLRALTACDHYARTLSRAVEIPSSAPASTAATAALQEAADRVVQNIELTAGLFDDGGAVHKADDRELCSAGDLLDRAESAAPDPVPARLLAAGRSLRGMDLAVLQLARELGATVVDEPPSPDRLATATA